MSCFCPYLGFEDAFICWFLFCALFCKLSVGSALFVLDYRIQFRPSQDFSTLLHL